MSTYAMGDVHGGYKAMVQAIERSPFKPEEDTLIQLGDIADGWPEVPECVEYLMKIPNGIWLRGNHDMWCRQWMEYGEVTRTWKTQGGAATLEAYVRANVDMEKHRDFFKNQRSYYIDDQNRGFVHGGFVSRKGLGNEAYESNYFWDRDLWQLAMLSHKKVHFDEDGSPHATRFNMHKEIFLGHSSTCQWNCKNHYPENNDPNQPSRSGPIMVPMNRCNVWNLDTGGGFMGKITIMDVDTKEYWQSDRVQDLYPEIKGR